MAVEDVCRAEFFQLRRVGGGGDGDDGAKGGEA